MAHVRIGVYKVTRGTWAEIADLARAGMLPIFQAQPGFIDYQLIDAGNSMGLSVSEWQTDEEATAATGEAAEWVQANIADRLQLQSNYVGDDLLAQG